MPANVSTPREFYKIWLAHKRINYIAADGTIMASFGYDGNRLDTDFYGTFDEKEHRKETVDPASVPPEVAPYAVHGRLVEKFFLAA